MFRGQYDADTCAVNTAGRHTGCIHKGVVLDPSIAVFVLLLRLVVFTAICAPLVWFFRLKKQGYSFFHAVIYAVIIGTVYVLLSSLMAAFHP